MHDHGPALSEDAFSPEEEACPFTLVELPCGCQDVHYACGYTDREHDYVACPGIPPEAPPWPAWMYGKGQASSDQED